jgi:hypothetical protein
LSSGHDIVDAVDQSLDKRHGQEYADIQFDCVAPSLGESVTFISVLSGQSSVATMR